MEKIEQHAREYIAYVWDVADSPEQAQKQLMKLFATHSKQLCVGFAEWKDENCKREHTLFKYKGGLYTYEQLYEHYLKYLKEKENAHN